MRVFVSSTYDDLIDYREEVLRALTRCEKIYRGMEFFGASSSTTLEHCLSQVEQSDLVICLLGTRYGSRPPGSHLSFTEHEISHAFEIKRPVHAYFIDDDQPVRRKHVDVGEDAEALEAFKGWLRERVSACPFTTPTDLAMKIMQDMSAYPPTRDNRLMRGKSDVTASSYRETAYDAIADWYDHWYKDHWCSDEPYLTIRRLAFKHADSSKTNLATRRILDTACGTGNTYAAFKKEGFEVFGTDGSSRMLSKAVANCEQQSLSLSGLVLEPITWTNWDGYSKHFEPESFDILLNTGNSFCHIPPVTGFIDAALENFLKLLKPGGLLIIDTKKYIREGNFDGTPLYKEMRFVTPEWIVRTVREEKCEVPGLEHVRFHTRLHYDVDPSFNIAVLRALIVLTIYGESLAPITALIPYYPLPAADLKRHMSEAGFITDLYPAGEGPAENWKYDVVVGRKPN